MSSSAPTISSEDYESHAEWLRRLARSLVRDPAAADDIAQETWLSALRHRPDQDESLRPWLARVVRNAARQLYRTDDRRQHREALATDAPEPLLSAAELSEHADLIHTLMGEVRDLAEPYRSTVLQSYLQGLTSAEIAAGLGIAEGTVRWRLAAARDDLRERMDKKTGSRENWAALVAPLGWAGKVVAGGQGAAKVAATAPRRALPWASWWPVLALGVPLAAIGTLWIVPGRHVEVLTSVAQLEPMVVDGPSETVAVRSARERVASARTMGAEPSVAVAPPRPLALDPGQSLVRLTVNGPDGQPLRGAQLRWTGSDDVFSSSSADGTVGLLFRPPVSGAPLEFLVTADGAVGVTVTGRPVGGELTDLGTLALVRAQTLRGVVRDTNGDLLKGARVFAAPLGLGDDGKDPRLLSRVKPASWSSLHLAAAHSSWSGQFALEGVPCQPVRVWAAAEGSWFVSSVVLTHPSAALTEAFEIMLEPLPEDEAITGTVLGSGGDPAADVLVRILPMSAGTAVGAEFEVETDAQGKFRLLPRQRERYELRCEDLLDRWADIGPRVVTPGSPPLELRFIRPLD